MPNTNKNLMLLTGAGFTRNFGGFLAREMWSKIFNNPLVQASAEARGLLLNDFDFESVYSAKMSHGEETIKIIRGAVEMAYKDLDDTVKNWVFNHDNPTALNTYGLGELFSFISSRGSDKGWFFTLNQDIYMERSRGYRSPGASFTQSMGHGDIGLITLPSEIDLEKTKNTLNNASYIKLHGSYGWISSHGGNQMVIGKNKVNDIDQEPLLKWYFEIFQNLIKEGNKKLLIIGYGFADNHINDILLNGIQEHGLSLYVISTTDPETFKNRLEGKPSHSGSWEVSKYSKIWDGVKGYFPYSLREIYPPDQSVTTISLEIKKALEN
ncbi:MAG: SIR2 family protein [Candidatus Nomurabacteria bacterium]|nr:SIR2 family protein [Candidatus Nomurabacteria bacterium]